MTDSGPFINAERQVVSPNESHVHQVRFGEYGFRGSLPGGISYEQYVLAITQAIADWRRYQRITGPLFLSAGKRALSAPAFDSVLRCLAANGVDVRVDESGGHTATPLVSYAITEYNRQTRFWGCERPDKADGLIVSAPHRPYEVAGIRYNTPEGGPATPDINDWIQNRAKRILETEGRDIRCCSRVDAFSKVQVWYYTYPYVTALDQVVDMDAIRRAGLKLAVDPAGGASLQVWEQISEHYDLGIDILGHQQVTDCHSLVSDWMTPVSGGSVSELATMQVISFSDRYDLVFGNDQAAEQCVVADHNGLVAPGPFMAVCLNYLLSHRPEWPLSISVGKSRSSSELLRRIVSNHGRQTHEVPGQFSSFVEGLAAGELGFAGKEDEGASFLTFSGDPWCTDRDGIVMCLLAAEILAVTGRTPSQYYDLLTARSSAIHCF